MQAHFGRNVLFPLDLFLHGDETLVVGLFRDSALSHSQRVVPATLGAHRVTFCGFTGGKLCYPAGLHFRLSDFSSPTREPCNLFKSKQVMCYQTQTLSLAISPFTCPRFRHPITFA